MLITTSNTLDYLITPLMFHFGDYDGSQYSEAVYRTSLINAVRYLSRRWNNKYIINSDNSVQPATIESQDEYAIVLAATVILRSVALTGSSSSFVNWQTPDLSISAGGQERVKTKLYEQAIKDLDDYFSKKLAKSIKRFMMLPDGTYPIPSNLPDTTPGAAVENT